MSKKEVWFQRFLHKAEKVHGSRYDYSQVEYIHSQKKIKIICKVHGPFEQTPTTHLKGSGCNLCSIDSSAEKHRSSSEKFVSRAKEVHGDKYDYSLVKYVDKNTKVTIVCPLHGEFSQNSNSHITNRYGCPLCGQLSKGSKLRRTTEHFISKVEYSGKWKKVKIICREHGYFMQDPKSHYDGVGCPTCNASKGELRLKELLQGKNFKSQVKMKDAEDKHYVVFDFVIYTKDGPVCIEYDGEQHFMPVVAFGGEEKFLLTKKRDERKNLLCREKGIPLVRIPYWDFENIEPILAKVFFDYKID